VRSHPAIEELRQYGFRHRWTHTRRTRLGPIHEYLPAQCESLLENGENNGFRGVDCPQFVCVLFTPGCFRPQGSSLTLHLGKSCVSESVWKDPDEPFHRVDPELMPTHEAFERTEQDLPC
jgi:hypothetical protein